MSRFVKGITLTPQERIAAEAPINEADTAAASASSSTFVTHAFRLPLPDGRPCTITYTRFSARSHQFAFGEPLQARLYHGGRLAKGAAGIEAKGKELLSQALEQARREEQRAMRGKGGGCARMKGRPDTGPEMDAKSAQRFAGQYAVCVRCGSGRLIRVGAVYEKAEDAQGEIDRGRFAAIRLQPGQALVVGVCNGPARKWQEPQFGPTGSLSTAEPSAVLPGEDNP